MLLMTERRWVLTFVRTTACAIKYPVVPAKAGTQWRFYGRPIN